jgi:hypothetical protein
MVFISVAGMLFLVILVTVPMFIAISVLRSTAARIAVAFVVIPNVGIAVPIVSNKEDRSIAGVVLAAMPAPVLLVAGLHVQIERRLRHGTAFDKDRLWIDEARGRGIAELNAPKKVGLSYVHRDPDLSKTGSDKHDHESERQKSWFHAESLAEKKRAVASPVEGSS